MDHMQGQEMMLSCNSGNPIRFEWAYRFASYIIVDCVQNLNSDVNRCWNTCTYCGSTVFMVWQQQDPSKLPGRLTVLLLDLWMTSTLLPYYAQLYRCPLQTTKEGPYAELISYILKCGNRQIHDIEILLDVTLFNPFKKKLVFVQSTQYQNK